MSERSSKAQNPIRQAIDVASDFVSYFKSEFPILDDELRSKLFQVLDRFDENHPFVRGPIVQVKSKSAPGVEVKIHDEIKRVLPWWQTPRLHQQIAWQKTINEGKNVVLATPTGSGKTEATLIPMIDRLLKNRGKKGLQALLVYPMNALLEDQHRRLTEQSDKDLPLLHPDWGIRCEILTGSSQRKGRKREEILSDPPEVLLTNYKMLELLLVRGQFKQMIEASEAELGFLFYDELHTYMGSKGAEVGWLNRRLKALAGIENGKLLCTAASATAQGDASGCKKVAEFASKFFDEAFDSDDVIIFKEDEKIENVQLDLGLDEQIVGGLPQKKIDSFEAVCREMYSHASHFSNSLEVWRKQSGRADLSKESAYLELLGKFDQYFHSLPEKQRHLELKAHSFFRGQVLISHPLTRSKFDFENNGVKSGFPIALCRECGVHGFLGREKKEDGDSFIEPAAERAYRDDESVVWLSPIYIPDEKKIEHVLLEQISKDRFSSSSAKEEDFNDAEKLSFSLLRVAKSKKKEDAVVGFTKCPNCKKQHPRGEQIRPMMSGTSTNMSVLMAGALSRIENEERRRLITFVDSRQDVSLQTAFTNEKNYKFRTLGLLYRYIKDGEALPFSFSFVDFLKQVKEWSGSWKSAWGLLASPELQDKTFESTFKDQLNLNDKRTEEFTWLYEEFRRLVFFSFSGDATDMDSIERSGLLSVSYKFGNDKTLHDLVEDFTKRTKLIQDQSILYSILRFSLDEIRKSSAPNQGKRDQHPNELGYGIFQRETDDSRGSFFTFIPTRLKKSKGVYRNRLSNYVTKLNAPSSDWDAEKWEEFGTALKDTLETSHAISPIRGRGEAFGVNPKVVYIDGNSTLSECKHCKHRRPLPSVDHDNVLEICSAYYCKAGVYEEVPQEDLEKSYYRNRYRLGAEMLHLRAAEHTGWTAPEDREIIENSFNKGAKADHSDVNLIIASPTLEMGVDLQSCPVVAFRNVPPFAANYQQRAGRAGRDEKAALCITHARNNPFDLYYFNDPSRIIEGKIHNLVMPLENRYLIDRHLLAHALETNEKDLVLVLKTWKKLAFENYPDGPPNYFIEPSITAVENNFLNPLHAYLKENEARFNEFVASSVASYKFNPDFLVGNLKKFFEKWIRKYHYDVEEFKKYVSIPGSKEKIQIEKRLQHHLGLYKNKDGEFQFQDWGPLFLLAEFGELPRYEFPGDLMELNLESARQADKEPMKEDSFTALYSWAPGTNRKIYVQGELFEPKYFKPKVSELSEAFLDGERSSFVEFKSDSERQDLDGASKYYHILEPEQVAAKCVGRIRDNSEERLRAKVKRSIIYDDDKDVDSVHFRQSVGSFYLNFKHPVDLRLVVEPLGGDGYSFCKACNVLLEPKVGGEGKRTTSISESQLDEHRAGCKSAGDPPLIHNVLLHAKRDNVPVIEICLENEVFQNDDEHTSVTESLLEALLLSGRDLLELGPRGDGLEGQVVNKGREVIMIYDPVPGGAGTIEPLWSSLTEWFKKALERMEGCDCGTACDACLLSYSNSMKHERLDRHLAIRVLKALTAEEAKEAKSRAVQFDRQSGPEQLLAMRFETLGVDSASAQPQEKLFDGHEHSADYRLKNGSLIFVDGASVHNRSDRFLKDLKIRNSLSLMKRNWVALTDRHIKYNFDRVPAILKWGGTAFDEKLVTSIFSPDQVKQFESTELEGGASGALTKLVRDRLAVVDFFEINWPELELKWSSDRLVLQNVFGELARDERNGFCLLFRKGVSGNFHHFIDFVAQRVLAGFRPLILDMDDDLKMAFEREFGRTARRA